MRRWSVWAVLVVMAAVGAWLWLRDDVEPTPPSEPALRSANEGALPALTSKWNEPIVARGAKAVTGVVLRDGQPVAGATVTALAAHGEDVLSDLPCQCDNHCGQKLLACGCAEASGQLVELVSARTGEGAPLGRATSATDGTFTLTGLDDQPLTLWADAPTGVAWKGDVASNATDVKLELSPGRTLRGTVKKTDGTPAAGALVTAIFAEQSRFFDTVAGVDGSFRLGPVPRGKYAVVAMTAGLLPDHQQVAEDRDATVELELSIPRALSGFVKRGDTPVPGATVKLEGMHRKRTVTTDAQGAFHLERLRPGEYELSASIGAELAHATSTVSKHEDRAGVVLALVKGVAISGLVTDEAGAGLAEATVYVDVDDAWRNTKTDAQGRFSFAAVSEGARRVLARHRGFLDEELTTHGGEVRLTLRRAAVLSGRVVGPDGALVTTFGAHAQRITDAGADEDEDDERVATPNSSASESSTDGGFALDLVPGQYTLTVTAKSFAPVTLTTPAPGEVLVTLEAGGRVRGQVVDLDGVPAADVRVFAAAKAGGARTITDATGHFVLEGLATGQHHLTASAFAERVITWRADADVMVTAGATTEVLLKPVEGARVAGVVISEDGAPQKDVAVSGWAAPTDGGFEPTGGGAARTDAEGKFRIRTLPAGAITLMARPDDSEPVTLRTRAPDERVVIKVKSANVIKGRVVDEKGKPVKTFRVLHRPFDTEDGRFSMPTAGGRDHLAFDAEGFAQRLLDVEVKPGVNDVGDVVLSAGRVVTGVVTDAVTKQPVADALVDVSTDKPTGRVVLAVELGAARTDATGHYRLTVDPASTWLAATHHDHLPAFAPLAPFMTTVDLVMESGVAVTVRLFDTTGLPVTQASVALTSRAVGFVPLRREGDTFVARAVAPGKWNIAVRARDKSFLPREVTVAPGAASFEVGEAAGGATVKVTVAEADQLVLGPPGVQVDDLDTMMGSSIPLVAGVGKNIPAGPWTLVAVRMSGSDFEVSLHKLEVSTKPEQDFSFTPKWTALKR